MKQSARGFSLSELLIVVIVIGILAAVVLPRYSKTMETRKTTEAENIMEAVRTEQERRCALSKTYVGNIAQLSDIVPNATTGNFTYSLSGTGVLASSQSSGYTLKMPSYADGRICCDGDDCSKLNKDYSTCEELTQRADYDGDDTCLSEADGGSATDVLQWGFTMGESELGDVYEAPELECRSTTSEYRPCASGCGNRGMQWRHCQSDNTWGDWETTCDVSEATNEVPCGCQNRGHRTQICEVNSTYPNGHWVDSGECSVPPCECVQGQTHSEDCGCNNLGKQNYRCGSDGSWVATGECKYTPPNQNPIPWTDQGQCTQDAPYQDCGCRHKGTIYKRCNTQTCMFYTGSNTYTECLRDGQTWPAQCECENHTKAIIHSDGGGYCSTTQAPNTSTNTLYNTFGRYVCTDITGRKCPLETAMLVKYCHHWKYVNPTGVVMCPCDLSEASGVKKDLKNAYLAAWSAHDTTAFPEGSGKLNGWWSRDNNIKKRDQWIKTYLAMWVSEAIPACSYGGSSSVSCDTNTDGVPYISQCLGYAPPWGGPYDPDPS